MPFIHRIVFSAARGQGAALRAALEVQAKARRAAGYQCRLGQILYGGDGQQFDLFFPFDNLAALEAFQGDPPSAAYVAQMNTLTAQVRVELLRVIVAMPAGGESPAYTTRSTLLPATGKGVQLRAGLETNTREMQAEGGRVGLAQVHGGSPKLVVSRLFATIGDLEKYLEGPGINEAQAKRTEGLFSAPPTLEIRKVLLPLN